MKLELDQDIAGILQPERAFDRRDFLSTALGASAALAASGTCRRSRSSPTPWDSRPAT